MKWLKKLFSPFDLGKQVVTGLYLVLILVLLPLLTIRNIWGEYLGTMGVLISFLTIWGLNEEFNEKEE